MAPSPCYLYGTDLTAATPREQAREAYGGMRQTHATSLRVPPAPKRSRGRCCSFAVVSRHGKMKASPPRPALVGHGASRLCPSRASPRPSRGISRPSDPEKPPSSDRTPRVLRDRGSAAQGERRCGARLQRRAGVAGVARPSSVWRCGPPCSRDAIGDWRCGLLAARRRRSNIDRRRPLVSAAPADTTDLLQPLAMTTCLGDVATVAHRAPAPVLQPAVINK
jgi:hypothetical protein